MDILNRYVWIFVSPSRVFANIREGRAPWWQPWLFVSAVGIVLGYFALPIQRELVVLNPSGMSPEQLEQQIDWITRFGWLQVLAAPLYALLAAVIMTGVTYILVSMMSEKASFSKYFAIMFYASCVAIMAQVVSTFVVRMRGVSAIRSADDAQATLSLGYIFNPDGAVLRGLMDSVEVFGVWSLILVAMGLIHVFEISRNRALAVVIPLWLVSAGFAVAGQLFSKVG